MDAAETRTTKMSTMNSTTIKIIIERNWNTCRVATPLEITHTESAYDLENTGKFTSI